jgi:hypothetical protein
VLITVFGWLSVLQISNFSTWSNLTILVLWIVVIFLVYYIKLSSREVHYLFAAICCQFILANWISSLISPYFS